MTVTRCFWAEKGDPVEQSYHDTEWGVPHHDDRALFELLTLEGAQAGLSWRTVLLRRDFYRDAYHGFDIERVAAMTDAELEALLTGSRLIRNRLKIYSVRDNARTAIEVIVTHGSLDHYLWSFVNHTSSETNGSTGRRCRRLPPHPIHEQGTEESWLPFCRFHNMLRIHAGDRNGERPYRHLLPAHPGVNPDAQPLPRQIPSRSGVWSMPTRMISSPCPTASGKCPSSAIPKSAPARNIRRC